MIVPRSTFAGNGSSSHGPSTTLKLAAEDAALFADDDDEEWEADMAEGDEEAEGKGEQLDALSSRVAAIC